MVALIETTRWHWVGFILCVLVFLALDLGVFHRYAHVVKFREAVAWTGVWFLLAMAFAFWLAPALVGQWERQHTIQFVTGYIVEWSLSLDNVLVIAVLFAHFRVPSAFQHRVLYWGILGALLMRGVMIAIGAALVQRFQWVLYLFGAFLLLTGAKMLLAKDHGVDPEKNFVLQLARKFFPITNEFHGQSFRALINGHWVLTPLALVVLLVETTDLLFAVDSIPAIFGVTKVPFVVFTSNVFAILGLRSLYFVLAAALGYFRYLKTGLSFVLAFIGIEMLIDPHDREPPRWFQADIPNGVSLLVVGGIVFLAITLSGFAAWREKRSGVRTA
jgi:tellurite resistance protein TerC